MQDSLSVMAGLVPAIHVLPAMPEDVDARHKAGHDGFTFKPLRLQLEMSTMFRKTLTP